MRQLRAAKLGVRLALPCNNFVSYKSPLYGLRDTRFALVRVWLLFTLRDAAQRIFGATLEGDR
jgi:hypothetical protein